MFIQIYSPKCSFLDTLMALKKQHKTYQIVKNDTKMGFPETTTATYTRTNTIVKYRCGHGSRETMRFEIQTNKEIRSPLPYKRVSK